MIPAKALPWRNPVGITYDSGDYVGAMQRALDNRRLGGFSEAPQGRPQARQARRHRGCKLIESTSGVPRERADIMVHADGRVDLVIGTQGDRARA